MASADTTGAIPSQTVPVVDRYRRWSPVWYPWIKRLLDGIRTAKDDLEAVEEDVTTLTTTVDGNTSSITQLVSSVNGLEAKWGIEININNRVVGLVKLDGNAASSTFSVLADKFVVVHPAANNTTIQAFIIGNVAGTPTVGINGNLIVDDTILARHIAVDVLSALTANLGTVTAGIIQSADGSSYWNLTTGEFVIGAP